MSLLERPALGGWHVEESPQVCPNCGYAEGCEGPERCTCGDPGPEPDPLSARRVLARACGRCGRRYDGLAVVTCYDCYGRVQEIVS